MIRHCEVFEKTVEDTGREKLKVNSASMQQANGGKVSKIISIAGPSTLCCVGLACGLTILVGLPTFGIGSLVGAAVAGCTLAVTTIDKHFQQNCAKVIDEIQQQNVQSIINCILQDVAKELSRMFEYQLFCLKNESEVKILAKCAVDLMLNLKKDDQFDRNTLLKKVLQENKMKRKEDLLTRNDEKWSSLDVFRKPGLRRTMVKADGAEFTYHVRSEQHCDTKTYGYRGEFLEIMKFEDQSAGESAGRGASSFSGSSNLMQFCKDCSQNLENNTNARGEYFAESTIDQEYSTKREEILLYQPLHVLIQCPKMLENFVSNDKAELSLADFLKNKFGLPHNHVVYPVYRQHSPGRVSHLTKTDLTGADFSHCNFTSSSLEECNFTKCVMLFTELAHARMSRSKFLETTIIHSNLENVKADHCEWTKALVLFSHAKGADLSCAKTSVENGCFNGTGLSDAITSMEEEHNTIQGNDMPEIENRLGTANMVVKTYV